MINLLFTIAIGAISGYFFFHKKLPAGIMIGAIIGTAAFNIATGMARVPDEIRFFSQAVSGAAIGFGFSRDDLARLPALMKPLGLLLSGLIAVNLTVGLLIYRFSPLDIVTSLICCLPGALNSAPIIAAEMGGDMTQVALLQFVRMSLSIIAFPLLLSFMQDDPHRIPNHSFSSKIVKPNDSPAKKQDAGGIWTYLFMLAAAISGSLLGKWIGIPGGTIVGSMLLTMLCKLCMPKLVLPLSIKRSAQVLAGSYIGGHISKQDLISLPGLLIPILLIVSGYFIYWILLGKAMQRLFGLEKKAAFLSVIPAGGGDMALIAADLGVENTDLLVMQVFRMVVVTGIFPQILALISKWMP